MCCGLAGCPVSHLPEHLHTFTGGLDAVLGALALTAGKKKKKKDMVLAPTVPAIERERELLMR